MIQFQQLVRLTDSGNTPPILQIWKFHADDWGAGLGGVGGSQSGRGESGCIKPTRNECVITSDNLYLSELKYWRELDMQVWDTS